MKYSLDPKGFKVRHWRHLYDACISSLETLATLNDATFVVFDAEPWGSDNNLPAELGISILMHPTGEPLERKTDTLMTLHDFVEAYAVETHQIQIAGIERPRRCESNRFGTEHIVARHDVQQHVMSLVDSHRSRREVGPDIILVAFDIHYEFRLLSTIFDRLTHYFNS